MNYTPEQQMQFEEQQGILVPITQPAIASIVVREDKQVQLMPIDQFADTDYILSRLELSRGTLAILCATGYSGKSLLIQYLSTCVSAGKDFLGSPTRQGKVIHIDQEQSERQTLLRYSRIGYGMGLTSLDVRRVVLDRYLDDPNLNPKNTEQELVARLLGATLVVIDSLKGLTCVDENSSEIDVVVKMLKRVAEKTGCAIVLIHHKGKNNGSGQKQSGRGHSSIYDSVDVQIDLDTNGTTYHLSCSKNREGRLFPGIEYQINDTGDFITGKKCTAGIQFSVLQDNVQTKTTKLNHKIMELLHERSSMKQQELYDEVGGDRNTFGAMLKDMEKSQLLSMSKDGKSNVWSMTDKGKTSVEWA